MSRELKPGGGKDFRSLSRAVATMRHVRARFARGLLDGTAGKRWSGSIWAVGLID